MGDGKHAGMIHDSRSMKLYMKENEWSRLSHGPRVMYHISSRAAFGFLAIDSGGAALFWRSCSIVASSALITEVWALRIACGMAVDRGVMDACFESDCKEVIDSINNTGFQRPWEISTLVESNGLHKELELDSSGE